MSFLCVVPLLFTSKQDGPDVRTPWIRSRSPLLLLINGVFGVLPECSEALPYVRSALGDVELTRVKF